jgi:anti-anti-sigma regulatory factor
MHELRNENEILIVRISGVVDQDDASALASKVHSWLDEAPGGARMLVDASGLQIYSPEGADLLLGFMKKANPKLERAAFIAPTSGTAALQLTRLIREAGGNNRRVFADPEEARRWLKE